MAELRRGTRDKEHVMPLTNIPKCICTGTTINPECPCCGEIAPQLAPSLTVTKTTTDSQQMAISPAISVSSLIDGIAQEVGAFFKA